VSVRFWVAFWIGFLVCLPVGWWIGGRITRWLGRRALARELEELRRRRVGRW